MLEQGVTTLELLKSSKVVENDLKWNHKICRAGLLSFMKQVLGEIRPAVIGNFASGILDSLDGIEDIVYASQSPENRICGNEKLPEFT